MENKFRAFDKFNEDMFYSGERLSKFFQQVERLIKGGNHVEVTQYMGLTDRNGKELFIGDIYTKWEGEEPEVAEDILSIGYQHGECTLLEGENGFEIVGNIYQSPELIEESK